MKAAVIVFPGSNCDRDMAVALEQATGTKPQMVWHADHQLDNNLDLIVIPGGFSYGDYLRCGSMSAQSPIMQEVKKAGQQGRYILGVCNGFQVLTESGLLPGTLMRNRDIKFICKNVNLKVENNDTPFTNNYGSGEVISIPIAHHDGNYFTDSQTLSEIENNGQVAFRYCDESGNVNPESNPNGSQNNIAGIFNESKTILGMMPHPERVIDSLTGGTDGKNLFSGLNKLLAA